MDTRTPLADGSSLSLGSRTYTITSFIGCGATSFVYTAQYNDSVHIHKHHSVLIKELFPYHPDGAVSRGGNNDIVCAEEALSYFELRKKSFLRGNIAHIDLQNTRADMTGVNIDSFEEHGSVYTIMGRFEGETLKSVMAGGRPTVTLACVLSWVQSLLDALELFHKNNLLHLDISPDNMLLLPLDEGKSEKHRRIILIDYNSVWSADELLGGDDVYFNIKECYTAPEIRLKETRSIAAASDLFSVCAVMLELLRGSPLDYSALYTGGRFIDPDAGLLKYAEPAIKAKVMEILRRGLSMSPKRRYASISELRRDLAELERLVFGDDVVKRVTAFFNRRALLIVAVTLIMAFGLSFAAIGISRRYGSYPTAVRDINITKNAMTALASSLTQLGAHIKNDLEGVHVYDAAAAVYQRYDEESISVFLSAGSPIRRDLLLELLNAPGDYHTWSVNMNEELAVFLSDAKYPGKDKETVSRAFVDYVDAYADICYIKLQLILLPLNDEGRRGLLEPLPYIMVFGDKFAARPFSTSGAELEGALKALNNTLEDIITLLKSYGVTVNKL